MRCFVCMSEATTDALDYRPNGLPICAECERRQETVKLERLADASGYEDEKLWLLLPVVCALVAGWLSETMGFASWVTIGLSLLSGAVGGAVLRLVLHPKTIARAWAEDDDLDLFL